MRAKSERRREKILTLLGSPFAYANNFRSDCAGPRLELHERCWPARICDKRRDFCSPAGRVECLAMTIALSLESETHRPASQRVQRPRQGTFKGSRIQFESREACRGRRQQKARSRASASRAQTKTQSREVGEEVESRRCGEGEQEEDEKMDGKTGTAMRCESRTKCGSLPSENSRSFQSHRHRQRDAPSRRATHNSGIESAFGDLRACRSHALACIEARASGKPRELPHTCAIAGNYLCCTLHPRVLVA